MRQHALRRWVVLGALVGALCLFSSDASAGWGHQSRYYAGYSGWYGGSSYGYGCGCYGPYYGVSSYRSCGYVPSYRTCYTPCYDPCYSVCDPCYTGCGLLGRLRARHLSGWGWGCGRRCWDPCACYTCGCDPCCCDPCGICGSWDPCGCGVTVDQSQIIMPEGPQPVPATGPTPSTKGTVIPPKPTSPKPPAVTVPPTPAKHTSLGRTSALLTVQVPADARVMVNGMSTQSKGAVRRYVSRNLVPGYRYTYELKVIQTIDGKPFAQTRTVNLRAGDVTKVAFAAERPANVETMLTLHVPAGAKVYLAGNEVKGNSAVRTFRTHKLTTGEAWNDYQIRVTLDRDGRTLSKSKEIVLNGGDHRELEFNFDVDKLASAR